jgi:hypothetical protein
MKTGNFLPKNLILTLLAKCGSKKKRRVAANVISVGAEGQNFM